MHPAILLIDNLNDFSGSEIQAFYIARFLQERGHRTELWTFRTGIFSEHCQAQGVTVRAFRKTGVLRPDGARLYGEMERAMRAFSKGEPLILQSFHTASNLLAPILAGRLDNVRVVATRRDMGFIRKPIHDVIQRSLTGWVSRLVAVSEDVKWIVALREGVDPERIDVVPNGVDGQRFRPPESSEDKAKRAELRSSLGLSPGEVLISSVGSMLPRKGHGTLVQALAGLIRRGLPVKLIAVGAGDGGPALKALGERLGVSRSLIIQDQRPDIPELLRASDIFSLLSHTEGFSNAVIEGMASGLPVVVTDVGGMREAVKAEAGFIVPVNDAGRTEAALAALASDEGLRGRMGAAGRAVAVEEHGFDKMLHRYLDIHERVLAEARR